jgi:hypothetical protein
MDPIPEGFGEFENISSSAIFTGKKTISIKNLLENY